MEHDNLIALTANIVSAHVAHNSVNVADVSDLIRNVHAALARTAAPVAELEGRPEPFVSLRASVRPDYLVCLEDGARLKMLKRYLRTKYDMSPDEYRARWGLSRDYPMTAPNYAEKRRSLARSIGLGRKARAESSTDIADGEAAPDTAEQGEGSQRSEKLRPAIG